MILIIRSPIHVLRPNSALATSTSGSAASTTVLNEHLRMEVLPLHRGRVTREREHVLLKGDNDLEVSHRWENAELRKVWHRTCLRFSRLFFAVTGTRFESVGVRT